MKNKKQDKGPQRMAINPNEESPFTKCKACGVSLVGGTLPKSDRRYYGHLTHHSTLIPLAKDKELPTLATHYQCPECKHEIAIFGDKEP
jgi:predicted RNA-binding Zn-ribbon protein involved in translation (DUF1610 family)